MIISRKVAVSAIMSVLALVAVWAAKQYLQIDLDPVQAMAVLLAVATSAGWLTKEDARVAGYLNLKGKHRVTVGDLVAERERDTEDGMYDTLTDLPATARR